MRQQGVCPRGDAKNAYMGRGKCRSHGHFDEAVAGRLWHGINYWRVDRQGFEVMAKLGERERSWRSERRTTDDDTNESPASPSARDYRADTIAK